MDNKNRCPSASDQSPSPTLIAELGASRLTGHRNEAKSSEVKKNLSPEPPLFRLIVPMFYITLLLSTLALSKYSKENFDLLPLFRLKIIPVYYNSYVEMGGNIDKAEIINACVCITLLLCILYIATRVIYEIVCKKTKVGKNKYAIKLTCVFVFGILIFSTMRFSHSYGLFDLSVSRSINANMCEISLYFGSFAIMLGELICQWIAYKRQN